MDFPKPSLGDTAQAAGPLTPAMDARAEPAQPITPEPAPFYTAATLAALARDLEADPATVTRLLDRLETKELVVRERSTSDRRVVHVRATPLGAAMAQELTPVLADTLNAHLAGFSTDEWQQLLVLLRRMLANGDSLRHCGISS